MRSVLITAFAGAALMASLGVPAQAPPAAAPAAPASALPRTPSAPGAEVYLISPQDGARVHNPVRVQFGLKGMGVAPAGVVFPNTGHHHLLIDVDAPADLGAPLPANEHVVHFGKGQTETTLTLSPGTHTLQLLFADANHVPHAPPLVSAKVTVTVLP